MDQKKRKKKKSTPTVKTLMTVIGTLIPFPLTEEYEAQQINETLKRNIVEKRATDIPYLEGVGPSVFKQQERELQLAAKRKADLKDAKASGEGTYAQGDTTSTRGVEEQWVEIRPSQTPTQNRPRGYSKIAEEAKRRKEEQATKAQAEKNQSKSFKPP